MKLIYVYDALCGWCYGFSPVMQEFYEKYKNELEFEVISGGMITGSRIGAIGDVAPYISWAYKDVENATGVKFGDHFLNDVLKKGTAIFTSIPPSVALSVFKKMQPEKSVAFAGRLQKAIYYDGIEPENLNEYGSLAQEFGLEGDLFVQKMQETSFIQLATQDFEKSKNLGVTGFPTVFLENNSKIIALARGYTSFGNLETNYLRLKESLK
jgi:putative protein-disulfide isomerase